MKVRIISIGVGVAVFLIHKIFFVDSGEVLKFNDALVDIVVSSDANFDPYPGFLGDYGEGKEVDVALMTAARDELKTTVESDLQILKDITVPEDELCQDFHSRCVAYVSNSADVVDKYEQQVAYISQHNPGTEQDLDALDAIIAEPLAKDEALFHAVVEVQGKMADKFNFELED